MKGSITYAPVDTAAGQGFVAWSSRGVVALETEVGRARFVTRLADLLGVQPQAGSLPRDLATRVRTALDGDTSHAPVDLSALPPFRQKVLKATMRIPAGQVRSYGQIAQAIGHPGAARAVGTAMARNPIPLLVPCHRVVRGDGTLGNYGMGGTARKAALLQREGFALPVG